MLSSRELASVLWIFILGAALLIFRGRAVWPSIRALLASVIHPKILLSILAVYAYVSLVVWVAWRIGAWDVSILKETIIWAAVAGFTVMFTSVSAHKDPSFLRKALIGVFGINVAVEYFYGIVSFPFWIEFVLQPVLLVLIVFEAARTLKSDGAEMVGKAAGCGLRVVGVTVLLGTGLQIWIQRHAIDWSQQGKVLAMTAWLPLATIPLVYLMSLAMSYGRAFSLLKIRRDGSSVPAWLKLAVLMGFNVRLHELGLLGGRGLHELSRASCFAEARSAVHAHRANLKDEDSRKAAAAARLRQFAGVEGDDEFGRRLDQREFAETKSALRWLATCHEGWYRHEDRGRYMADVLTIVGDFTRQGLPAEHGITMQISDDGQSWYAWRRTVTGWVLGIGAAGPPSDEWVYDGAEPPLGFPGREAAWARYTDPTPPNWLDSQPNATS